MQDLIIEFNPPTDFLQILKAYLDMATAVLFVVALIVIVIASRKYPLFARKDILYPLIIFAVLGIISTAMDAYDEWFWFTPKEFYDLIWKPTRLVLFIVAIFILVFAFQRFYTVSKRMLGED